MGDPDRLVTGQVRRRRGGARRWRFLPGDFRDEAGGGPDAGAGHAGWEGFQRVRSYELFDFNFDGDFGALTVEGAQLSGEARRESRGPAVFIAVGVGYFWRRSRTAGWSRCGRRTRSNAGWICIFSNVNTDEHVNAVVVLNHEFPVRYAERLACPRHHVSASTLRSAKKRVPVEPLSAIT